jgi:protocatechuate 3,4-dioxygenase beta subunit
MAEKEISPKLDGSQGTIEIRVKKGLWYEGRLTDKASGEPVKAYVDHLALRSNPNKLDSIGLRQGWEMERYHTDSKGGYRTAGLPGPGVLLVRAVELDGYPRAIGGDKVPGYDASLDYIPTTPVGMPLANWNLIIQVDPPKTAATFHRNIVLDAGQMIPGRLVAADEKPLSDVQVVGETLNNNWWMPHPNANFQLRGYDGKGPRQLLFQASGGSLVGRHRQEGPAPKEIVVKLAPAVRVKGRLIEGESGVAIYCEQSTIGKSHVDVTTKDDGRFEIKGLMAGAVYKMYIANRPRSLSMKKNFNIDLRQAKPGDLLDLGDIGGEQSADLRKSPQVSPKNDSPESSRPMTIRGTVLRPDGRPASDAQVSSFRFHWRSGDKIRWEPLGTTQANDHGDFELPSKPGDGSGADNIFFFATANGFGCAFKGWFVDPPNSLVMKLVPDQPIHGRVLDLEGKPVAGARIRVVSITDSLNRTLGPWLEAVKSGVPRYTLGAHQRLGDFIKTIPGASGSTTADHEGRFTLQGLGAERVVDLSIESDSTAYTQVTIATRHMEPIIHAALPMSPGGLEIFGANFTKAVKPTRPIVGIVRDAQTGKLLEGVAIESSRLAGEFFAGQRRLTTTTNAQGRYRMVGMPKGNGNALIVVPNDDQPYFMREIVVPEMAGIEPVTVDVELHRGLWITGRVIDKDTGKPVPANVNYWPFLTNTHTSGLPEFGPARRMAGDASRYRTRPDGSFRIPGLPGRGLVGAVALAGHYRQGAGASEIRDVDREGRFRTYENQVRPSLKYPTTMKAIDPADGSQTVTCDLVCDHGETVRVTVLDPDGKPVRNCSTSAPAKNGKVQGLNSPFEITNLSLNVEQPLLIEQKDRKLAKFIKFTPKGQAPNSLTVQLEPCATVSGRLVDEDGFALKGIAIEPRFRRGGDYWPRLTTVVCNLDGRFECTSLPSGVDVDFYAEGAGIDVIATFGRMSVPAGKTIDLGDVKVKRRQ